MEILNIFDDLLQPCADCEAVSIRIASVEGIENDSLIGVLLVKLALHHSELVQVCQ